MKFDWDWIPACAYTFSYIAIVILVALMAAGGVYQLVDYLISTTVRSLCGWF